MGLCNISYLIIHTSQVHISQLTFLPSQPSLQNTLHNPHATHCTCMYHFHTTVYTAYFALTSYTIHTSIHASCLQKMWRSCNPKFCRSRKRSKVASTYAKWQVINQQYCKQLLRSRVRPNSSLQLCSRVSRGNSVANGFRVRK